MVRIFMNQTLYQFDIPYFKEYFLPLNSFRTSMYCTVTVNKVKFQKKKTTFHGNYSRRYGSIQTNIANFRQLYKSWPTVLDKFGPIWASYDNLKKKTLKNYLLMFQFDLCLVDLYPAYFPVRCSCLQSRIFHCQLLQQYCPKNLK